MFNTCGIMGRSTRRDDVSLQAQDDGVARALTLKEGDVVGSTTVTFSSGYGMDTLGNGPRANRSR